MGKESRNGVGLPLNNTLVKIYSREKGSFLSFNEVGEICVFGPTVCRGYFKDEDMTKKLLQLHSDGKIWLHSGDLGYLDEKGCLHFCEREKRMYVCPF